MCHYEVTSVFISITRLFFWQSTFCIIERASFDDVPTQIPFNRSFAYIMIELDHALEVCTTLSLDWIAWFDTDGMIQYFSWKVCKYENDTLYTHYIYH